VSSGYLDQLFSLAGHRAIVTGASSGLGREMAKTLASAGAAIVLVARRGAALEELAAEIVSNGGQAECFAADLSDEVGLPQVGKALASRWSDADILVNAAGVNLRQPFHEVTPESWRTQIALHLSAPFFLSQALAPQMALKGYGRIINLASLQSWRAFANSAPYGAGKGGVVQLTRAIAQAWSAKGVTCNAIGPGFFPTELTAPVFDQPELAQQHANRTAIGRNGQLTDLHGLTVFLAAPASGYITGQTIMLDGGYTAQ
jgi:NAD(P)-dependent dehydrogenase (short-subunit alcohol dehydrogenase family)